MCIVFVFHEWIKPGVCVQTDLLLRRGCLFQNGMQVEVGLRSEIKNLDVGFQVLDGTCSAHRKTMALIYQIKVGKAKRNFEVV